ncbi:type IV pilin N-terminal domain-containing protein [Haloglomus litoreum]|uniref:type IV pilin N-terminal domain-containing protein n=1 Tax=Haloglomus litoreum TaxID=3034026 RepID=UPI0023E827BD|nr:type IV pilin N-terminal domain-containing protein [Haloglomus sp. DT116]
MDQRGVSSVIGAVLAVAIVVMLGSVIGTFALSFGDSVQPQAPQVQVSHAVTDDADPLIAITHESGESLAIDQLYVTASTPVDIGSATTANDDHASEREAFAESSGGNPPQVDIGETWDAGETVYLDPEGDIEGLTVRVLWNTQPVEGVNPGSVEGADSYTLVEFTV